MCSTLGLIHDMRDTRHYIIFCHSKKQLILVFIIGVEHIMDCCYKMNTTTTIQCESS